MATEMDQMAVTDDISSITVLKTRKHQSGAMVVSGRRVAGKLGAGFHLCDGMPDGDAVGALREMTNVKILPSPHSACYLQSVRSR